MVLGHGADLNRCVVGPHLDWIKVREIEGDIMREIYIYTRYIYIYAHIYIYM